MANANSSFQTLSLRSARLVIQPPPPSGNCFLLPAMALPKRAALDALHIDLAAANGIDILLTWNCAHIANPFMQPQIHAACVEFGVMPPTICTPLQLIEAQDNVERPNRRRDPE